MRFIRVSWAIALMALATNGVAQKSSVFKSGKFDGYGFSVATGKTEPANLFVVENGVIRLKGKNAGYLMTRRIYGNFEMTAEFRWADEQTDRAAAKRNSGIMFRVPVDAVDTLWPKGFQYQIKDNSTGDFVLLQEVTIEVNDSVCGPGKSVVVKRMADAEKPVGEWNQLRIVAKGDVIEQYLNGVLVNKGKKASVAKGRILFQYEGYPIDFRNIKIVAAKP